MARACIAQSGRAKAEDVESFVTRDFRCHKGHGRIERLLDGLECIVSVSQWENYACPHSACSVAALDGCGSELVGLDAAVGDWLDIKWRCFNQCRAPRLQDYGRRAAGNK